METAMVQRLHQSANRLAHLGQMLDSLSPLGTLQRGYAIVTDTSGQVVRIAGEVSVGDEVEARLAKGRLGLIVSKVKKR
jgi:exodeoxyribonuclease VII large subunit